MNYPKSVQMGGRKIQVNVIDKPIVREGTDKFYIGKFEPLASAITVYHADHIADVCHETFVHELVEAADVVYDLNLQHQTIQTLSSALFQALSSGSVSFSKGPNQHGVNV